ncbi:hypothetical protein [Paracoccus sp. (in: a-proteobacteria)]|uniref:hypothetical protein n=1 Tax=Paracoccus sp. TaxID=267 RepID=UPI004059713F
MKEVTSFITAAMADEDVRVALEDNDALRQAVANEVARIIDQKLGMQGHGDYTVLEYDGDATGGYIHVSRNYATDNLSSFAVIYSTEIN